MRPAARVAATQRSRLSGGAGQLGDPIEPCLVDARASKRLGELPGLGDAERLQTGEQVVLGVGGVERVEASRCGGPLDRLALQRDQLLGFGALDPRLDEARDRRADRLEHLGHLRSCPAGSRGRIVELVREAGGHRPERGEPLAVLTDAGDAGDDRRDLRHHALVDGLVGEHQPAEVRRFDDGDAT